MNPVLLSFIKFYKLVSSRCLNLTTPRNGGICFSRSTLAPLRILGGRVFRRADAQIDFFSGDGWATDFPEDIPDLVNVYKKLWKDPPFYSWVNHLFLWPFLIAMLVYQRVLEIHMKYWYCII